MIRPLSLSCLGAGGGRLRRHGTVMQLIWGTKRKREEGKEKRAKRKGTKRKGTKRKRASDTDGDEGAAGCAAEGEAEETVGWREGGGDREIVW